MTEAVEQRSNRGKVAGYISNTIKDVTGIRGAREVAGDHDVVRVDGNIVSVDARAVAAGAADIAAPIMTRSWRHIVKKYDDASSPDYDFDSPAWIGYPTSMFGELIITAGALVIAKNQGSFQDSAEVFTAIKAAEAGFATVGRDVIKATVNYFIRPPQTDIAPSQ